ncbi:hypothetical protein WICMUC_000567 [Wickerhamomyces mucosus]|uniref:3-hydroxyisobutyryl-coenzyme A hydrolase n=1 Tax=Wickerhamomyces mucosus TaxID=1378264 RepID=A0A9P8PZH3_9ASCO|nr:hypothetical protein WICMUC_000567 [Wickerhamomyces mucosus]
MTEGRDILYEIHDKVAIITLNLPQVYNSLNNDQYLLLGKLVERANDNNSTLFTLIQSTGKYFSSGANVKDISLDFNVDVNNDLEETKYWLNNFTSRNAYLTHIFYSHKKILVGALNGPCIGLTTGLVALMDIIYSINDEDVFLLAPFANLGLVTEGGIGYTLLSRLGLSYANEALLLSKPIHVKRLLQIGFINKNFQFKSNQVDQFNKSVLKELLNSSINLESESILDIKEIIKSNYLKDLESINSKEIIIGLKKWLKHLPQERFKKIASKNLKHKL